MMYLGCQWSKGACLEMPVPMGTADPPPSLARVLNPHPPYESIPPPFPSPSFGAQICATLRVVVIHVNILGDLHCETQSCQKAPRPEAGPQGAARPCLGVFILHAVWTLFPDPSSGICDYQLLGSCSCSVRMECLGRDSHS